MIIIKWEGPGFYVRQKGCANVFRICGSDDSTEARALARLAGFEGDTVSYLSKKPEQSRFITVKDISKVK